MGTWGGGSERKRRCSRMAEVSQVRMARMRYMKTCMLGTNMVLHGINDIQAER